MLTFLSQSTKDKTKHKNFLESAASFLFGNTEKLANTVGALGSGVGSLAKVGAGAVTGNEKAKKNALNKAESGMDAWLNPGRGIGGEGGLFKSAKEAGAATPADIAKKSVGGGVGVATEIVPFGKGVGVGSKAASKGGKFIQALTSGAKTGAAYGAAGGAANDLVDNGNVSVEDIIKGALQGAAIGGAASGVGYGGKKVIKSGSQAAKTVSSKLSVDNHPKLQALSEHRQTLQTAYDNAPSATAKKQLSKAIADVNQEYGKVRKSITQGGYIGKGEEPAKKAMDVLAPTPEKQATTKAIQAEATAAGSKIEKPVTLIDALDAQLGKFGDKYKTPENIKTALKSSKSVGSPASRLQWTETFRDPTGVLGSHFGEVGSTAAYKIQQGAKVVSDLEEAIRPDIQKARKLLNKTAKTDIGRADVQQRVYNALEDRANIDKYLKTPQEKELYNTTAKVFDFFKAQRQARGKNVLENYSPRTAVKDALDAPDRMLNNVKQAFSPNTQSQFSKQRINDLPDAELNKRIVELLPHYASSQSKEFAYSEAMDYIKKNLPNVNPAYIANEGSRRRGEVYLQNLLTQTLQPAIPTKAERIQNKLIANTYKSQLGFSPKFAAQNLTQRYATKTQVSKGATKLAKRIDKADLEELRKSITTGFNPILSEAGQTAESTGKVGGVMGKLGKLDPGQVVEKGNVGGAFDRGVAQAVLESDIYKAAIKSGMKPAAAAKKALADETTRDLAIRRGNMVVNTTQFGGNFAAKPEFLRDQGSFLGLSKKWYQQYQRFPTGMIQIIGNVVKPDDARALDILRRGDPRQTPIVDYWKAAKSLQTGAKDLVKAANRGEVANVSSKDAKAYKSMLDEAVVNLEKQMKGASQIRAGKTAKNLAKMWAAASAIQFLFDGGDASQTAKDKGVGAEVSHSIKFGAPINIPTKSENPLLGARIPSSPVNPNTGKISGRKLLNFVPGVGLAVNRGRDISKLVNAISGD